MKDTSKNDLISRLRTLAGMYEREARNHGVMSLLREAADGLSIETSVTNSPLAQAVLDRVVAANLGMFLTAAVDHIEKGGNIASGEVELTDGTKVELRMSRAGSSEKAATQCVFRTGCVNGQKCVDAGHCTHGAEMLESMQRAEKASVPICPTCKTALAFEGDTCGLCHPEVQP